MVKGSGLPAEPSHRASLDGNGTFPSKSVGLIDLWGLQLIAGSVFMISETILVIAGSVSIVASCDGCPGRVPK